MERAESVTLITSFPYDPTGARQSAIKSLGFYWDPANKYWSREVKYFKVPEVVKDAEAKGFKLYLAEKETKEIIALLI